MGVLFDGVKLGVAAKRSPVVLEPLLGGLILMFPLAFAFATGRIWLFPSLGPTAYLQTTSPELQSARPYNVILGHLGGIAAGFLALAMLGALGAPSIMARHELVAVRMWASILAISLNILFAVLLHSYHPPSAATVLIVTLGALPTTSTTVVNIFVGVIIVAFFGEIVRRVRSAERGFDLRKEIPWDLSPLLELKRKIAR